MELILVLLAMILVCFVLSYVDQKTNYEKYNVLKYSNGEQVCFTVPYYFWQQKKVGTVKRDFPPQGGIYSIEGFDFVITDFAGSAPRSEGTPLIEKELIYYGRPYVKETPTYFNQFNIEASGNSGIFIDINQHNHELLQIENHISQATYISPIDKKRMMQIITDMEQGEISKDQGKTFLDIVQRYEPLASLAAHLINTISLFFRN